ncbi:3-oxoacyl-ACP reductase [Pseudomonas chlororaphis]|uniref:3-oxoacyl-ACP reductase n=1 Tax=Pseudomonas chlororaphis TaxID=587753 RepID=A0A3G7TMI6_9PSED|nr:glucose 1-dehydrogenase [Pseudomonas chlororaphis]AZE48230.1 3-oxoacyl-ACP reductase [Pseudomonas chlororaphis]
MSKLIGKVCIVTGASKGIGAGIAKKLGAAGAAVVVNYNGNKQDADRVVVEITSNGGKAIAVQADVSKAADVTRLFAEAVKAFGTVNVLVNNAGVYTFGPIETVTEDEFHRQININLLGVFLTTQIAVAQMGESGGSIINITSAAVEKYPEGSSLYTASKAAVSAATKVLSKELGAKKIRINAVSPGYTESEGQHSLGVMGSDFLNEQIAATPLKRIGQPQDIAPVVEFLASDDSAWVTGTEILVSGGYR